jgi:hypothetical protein
MAMRGVAPLLSPIGVSINCTWGGSRNQRECQPPIANAPFADSAFIL